MTTLDEHCGRMGKIVYFNVQGHEDDFIGSQQDYF